MNGIKTKSTQSKAENTKNLDFRDRDRSKVKVDTTNRQNRYLNLCGFEGSNIFIMTSRKLQERSNVLKFVNLVLNFK